MLADPGVASARTRMRPKPSGCLPSAGPAIGSPIITESMIVTWGPSDAARASQSASSRVPGSGV